MVLTRSQLSVKMYNKLETVVENISNVDDAYENQVVNICSHIKILQGNHPEIDFSGLESSIGEILINLDESLARINFFKEQTEDLQLKNDELIGKIQDEKMQRRVQLNDSLTTQEQILEEKHILVEDINLLKASLSEYKIKLDNSNIEYSSLQSLVIEMESTIVTLNKTITEYEEKQLSLNQYINRLKGELKVAKSMAWSESRWLDDNVLEAYFVSFSESVSTGFNSKCLFIGPRNTQLLKHGSYEDAIVLLNQIGYFESDFVFLCVSDSSLTLKDDSGSHWSLLFLDLKSETAYHLDSLPGYNLSSAQEIINKLRLSSVVDMPCTKQNNGFECGLRVLVNTKFVLDYFCKHRHSGSSKLSFSEWYSEAAVRGARWPEESPAPPAPQLPAAVNSPKLPVQPLEDVNWTLVQNKNNSKRQKAKLVNKPTLVKCSNKFSILDDQKQKCEDVKSLKSVSGLWSVEHTRNSKKPLTKKKIFNECKSISTIGNTNNNNKLLNNNKHKLQDVSYVTNVVDVPKCDNSKWKRNVLLIGDSIIRHASKLSSEKGAYIECCPGGRILDIKTKLLKYADHDLSVIYIHVGTNNLKMGFSGRAGYNGGHGKREALHAMADLLFTVKTLFPSAVTFLNSILVRSDIGYKALFHFNDQVELMCSNFGVVFVEANCWIERHHLARDGRHLNGRGNLRLGELFSSLICGILEVLDTVEANGSLSEVASCADGSDGNHHGGVFQSSGNGNSVEGIMMA